jgi:hypothetical protein
VAGRWLTPDEDARTARWAEACDPLHPRAWCNPPYSKVAGEGGAGLLTWVEAAVRARDEGLVVALLVPPSTSTRYWRLGCAEAAEILLLARRVAFLDPNTGLPQRGNRGDSAILIFRPGQRGPALCPVVVAAFRRCLMGDENAQSVGVEAEHWTSPWSVKPRSPSGLGRGMANS